MARQPARAAPAGCWCWWSTAIRNIYRCRRQLRPEQRLRAAVPASAPEPGLLAGARPACAPNQRDDATVWLDDHGIELEPQGHGRTVKQTPHKECGLLKQRQMQNNVSARIFEGTYCIRRTEVSLSTTQIRTDAKGAVQAISVET